MAEKKVYRSALRSRRLIRQAFLELLKEKPFEKITVTDIVNQADINRSTFYAHYPDIYGVVDEIETEVVQHTLQIWAETKFINFFHDPKPILQSIVSILEENHDLYKSLGQSNIAAPQLERMKAVFISTALTSPEIPRELRDSPLYAIRIRFFIGGIVDVYQCWLRGTWSALWRISPQTSRR